MDEDTIALATLAARVYPTLGALGHRGDVAVAQSVELASMLLKAADAKIHGEPPPLQPPALPSQQASAVPPSLAQRGPDLAPPTRADNPSQHQTP